MATNRNWKLLSVLLLGLGVGSTAVAAELPFGRLTPFDPYTPLPSASVRNVAFDAQGQVWLTVYSSGLGYYSGDKLKVFGTESGLASVTVNGLAIDRDGFVWVASEKGVSLSTAPTQALYEGRPFGFRVRSGTVTLPEERVVSGPHLDRDGLGVWVLTPESLHRLQRGDADTVEVQTYPLPGLQVAGMALLGETLWLFEPSSLSRLSAAEPDIENRVSEPAPCAVPSAYLEYRGHRYLGCKREGFWTQPLNQPSVAWRSIAAASDVRQIRKDGDAVLWAGSEGVYRGDATGAKTHFGSASGFAGSAIDVVRSPSGGLWISGQEGIHTLPSDYATLTKFTKFLGDEATFPLTDNRLARRARVGGDWLWLGGSDLLIADRASLASLGFLKLEERESAWVACEGPNQASMWIGTNMRLLRLATDSRTPKGMTSAGRLDVGDTRFSVSQRQFSRSTSCLSFRRGDTRGLCFSRPEGITCLDTKDNEHRFDHRHGLPKAAMQGLALDQDGYLYSGSYANGLFRSTAPIERLMNQRVPRFEEVTSERRALPTRNVEAIEFVDSYMILATDAGMVVFEGNQAQPKYVLNSDNGLGNTYVYAIAPDDDGNVWVGGNEGITRVRVSDGTVLDRLSKGQGLIDQETPWHQSIVALVRGGVSFATNDAHLLYRPSQGGLGEMQELKVQIRHFTMSYREYRSQNDLRFRFGVGPRDNLERIWYRYRIRPDDPFSEPTTDARGVIQNLQAFGGPRVYTLEVQASLDRATWSAEARQSVEVRPPVIFTWWVMLTVLSVGALLIWLGVRWRLSVIRERAEVLGRLAEALGQANEAKEKELTERKALAAQLTIKSQELEVALDGAEAADRLKGQILANLSHELRTPLNALINIPTILCEQIASERVWVCSACQGSFVDDEPHDDEMSGPVACPDCGVVGLVVSERLTSEIEPEEVMKLLHRTSTSGTNLAKTVEDMLEFAKLESGTMTIERRDVALAPTLQALCERMQRTADERRVEIVPFIPSECPPVSMQQSLFEMMVRKILENAIEFAPVDSVVLLSVTPDMEAKTLELSIRDEGVGIDPKDHTLIFESFRQADGGHTRSHQGVGLGLAITSRVVELHGWRIDVDSAKGEGATFSVTLPLYSG